MASLSTKSAAATATAAVHCTDHLAQTVPNSAAVIIYAFNTAHQLVKGLTASAAASGNSTSLGGLDKASVAGVGGDADDHRKCVLLRAMAVASGGGGGGPGDDGGGAGGFGPALEAGLSRPVLAEEMGETHLWVVDSHGRRHLAAAFVSLQRATVFITLSASAQFPPFRVENRSSAETLAYRQVGWRSDETYLRRRVGGFYCCARALGFPPSTYIVSEAERALQTNDCLTSARAFVLCRCAISRCLHFTRVVG